MAGDQQALEKQVSCDGNPHGPRGKEFNYWDQGFFVGERSSNLFMPIKEVSCKMLEQMKQGGWGLPAEELLLPLVAGGKGDDGPVHSVGRHLPKGSAEQLFSWHCPFKPPSKFIFLLQKK